MGLETERETISVAVLATTGLSKRQTSKTNTIRGVSTIVTLIESTIQPVILVRGGEINL